jgi:hypothetical protein
MYSTLLAVSLSGCVVYASATAKQWPTCTLYKYFNKDRNFLWSNSDCTSNPLYADSL